jgi:hypothetical protein
MAAKKKTTANRKNTRKAKVKTEAKAKLKVTEMAQTHAMEEKESFEKTSLEQIWGDTGMGRYGTQDEDKYLGRIKGLNRSDLHSHAVKMGILPIDNRELLTSRLVREFKKYVLSYNKPKSTPIKGKRVSGKARSILAEGR